MPEGENCNILLNGLNYCIVSPFLFSILLGGHPITIDGQFPDWDNVPLAYSDIEGDGMSADFADMKFTYDMEFLFMYFKKLIKNSCNKGFFCLISLLPDN